LRARFARIFAVGAIGLGVAATLARIIVWGWVLLRAARMVL
jgi:hypothetical protein